MNNHFVIPDNWCFDFPLHCRSCFKKIFNEESFITKKTNLKKNPLNRYDIYYDEKGFLLWVYCIKCNQMIIDVNYNACTECGLHLDHCRCQWLINAKEGGEWK
jgi:hypothetical protein